MLAGSGGGHALLEGFVEVGGAAFEEKLRVTDCFGVGLGGGEVFDAGAETAADVVLQAGARVVAGEVDLAAGQKKAAMDEVDDAVGEVAGEVGAVVDAAVAAEAAGDEDFRPAIAEGELYIGIGFVVAQQDVEAGLALLDEVVFQRERFVLVVDEDVVDVDGIAHEGAGFGVGLGGFKEVGADPGAEVFGLADVDDLAVGVFI